MSFVQIRPDGESHVMIFKTLLRYKQTLFLVSAKRGGDARWFLAFC